MTRGDLRQCHLILNNRKYRTVKQSMWQVCMHVICKHHAKRIYRETGTPLENTFLEKCTRFVLCRILLQAYFTGIGSHTHTQHTHTHTHTHTTHTTQTQTRKGRQCDSIGIHWRRWGLSSTFLVNIRAVNLTTFPFQCSKFTMKA